MTNKIQEANLAMVVSKTFSGLNVNALRYLLPLWIARGELTDASHLAWRSKACREWSADGVVLGSSNRGRPES